MMALTTELAADVGVHRACATLGVPRSSYYRSQSPPPKAKHTARRRAPSPRALSGDEEETVLAVLHQERFIDRSPAHVVAALLDEEKWLCSERTMYRILEKQGESKERRKQRSHPTYVVPRLRATGPNQVWTWDVTRVRGTGRGQWFYLYVLLDLYSRAVVGWTLSRRIIAVVAGHLLQETLTGQGVSSRDITIHNDRGSEFVAATIVKLMDDLELTRSLSRPRTSNDNAYSESAFKTLKYDPSYPGVFPGYEPAWAYFEQFFTWYNQEHRHSGIAYLTPNEVYCGRGDEVLKRRKEVKQAAFKRTPQRFVRGAPMISELPQEVWINRPEEDPEKCGKGQLT
jgi:putative transposase